MALTGYSLSLVQASWMTVQLAFTSLLVGLILAVVFASGEMSRRVFVKWPMTAFVTIVRGLPEILVVLFIYFGSTQVLFLITGDFIEVSPFLSGVVALSLIFASYASQTLRGALKAVGRGQREAASALGISPAHAFVRIVLPQAVRHALPGLTNQWLVLLKDTALVSLIGVTDLLKQAQLTSAATHEAFTWYATAAAIYLGITLITQRAVKLIDKKFSIQGMSMGQEATA
ncbi:arginine ABC transporter permease ArtQ [Vibrio campbellii]|uniref:Arginine ABC transporter permease ArtQ n=1 Tax=Vibrio campbellii TaxID=680 RepID=A0AAE9N074_9VIBR|nr:arginine ABC transporter permease ArtQ [Vibrio campbellii]ARV74640.1 ABC transporter [Vibrio campbellii CAIM 519 = NBRC 15631 = ATCC 25920]ELU52150.1 arginine transporter permease subunit ArtQ [Vibrio campbellii CAIM 519 = NBRC 15631 = ATCC 25920]MED5502967.1 arginine ABC transporter permease ArtQ [Pseudomonadota bacterium]UTZ28801.1 arginine ABC transporter permease ArtQ [Vibrio campbellii]|tara:strand:+ start:761 stop:1450 length:690 start_codon:yes stop_codon:yes gene_type:complete